MNWKKLIGITAATLGTAFVATSIVAKLKKGNSVYENDSDQKNPLEGKKVIFVENEDEPENADGVRGHLEAVGESDHVPGFYEKYIKRGMDIILSFGGLIVLSPVLLGISIAIKVDDPGPVLFTQKRMGQNKKYFRLHKFRSMKMCTPHDKPTHMLENPEQYITKVGKFLRAHSLDELPQIWDIFIGNMSVIGPRPGLWNQDLLTAERDKYGANDVKPGLTGWAQINGRDELEIEDKARLDGEYCENIGLKTDTKVFLGSLHVFGKDDSVVEGGTREMKKKEKDTSSKKILYITAEGFDTPNPNNQMAEVMIRDFLDNGYHVHLVQSHRKGINPDIPESLQGRDGLTVDTVTRKVVDKKNFVNRYLNDSFYAFQAMKVWVKDHDADVIYLQSNPTILYSILLLKLFKRKPIVYSIYDVFPGHANDIGVINSKFIYNTLRIMQKPCYKMADAITVLGEDMKIKVVEQGAKDKDVYVVPAWYDVSTAREIPIEENRFIQKYNIPTDKFIVGFAGTVGYVFNYKTVIELAKRLKPYSEIVIEIVGDGNIKDDFVREAKELGLDNIWFYPLQPVDLVPDVYSACNIAIIPLRKGVIGNGVPSKAPILMACNRVIVNSVEGNSIYAKLFDENDMGKAVDIFDYDGLAKAVVELYKSPETVERMAANAKQYSRDNYSSTKSTEKLMQIFDMKMKRKRNKNISK